MAQRYAKRLQKELKELQTSPPAGISIQDVSSLDRWLIQVHGAAGTLYSGETFTLQFRFTAMYPMESPEVIFVGQSVPKHEHIYTNGHICLSILYDSWSPALSVASVCISIQSMLSSATEKRHPLDNNNYVSSCKGKSPKETRWWFHDDKV